MKKGHIIIDKLGPSMLLLTTSDSQLMGKRRRIGFNYYSILNVNIEWHCMQIEMNLNSTRFKLKLEVSYNRVIIISWRILVSFRIFQNSFFLP
jgi:hypothetical protein